MRTDLQTILDYGRHRLFAKRGGHGVHSPFAYTLCEEVFYNHESFYDFKRFEHTRIRLLKLNAEVHAGDFGAGSKVFHGSRRKIADIVRRGISTPQQSETLYRLVNFLNPANVIELGTSVGLNALYLASSAGGKPVYSIEGSSDLSEFARLLAQEESISNLKFITGNFDEVLPGILTEVKEAGLVYIDGNHTYEATLRYFDLALAHSNSNTVIAFDDIHWSTGMKRAWNEICSRPEVRMSIDTWHTGYVFFRKEIREKTHLRMVV
jgi:predicted O-methyltransferase YrrM